MGGTCCSCMFIAVCPVLLGTDCADWDKERKAFPALGIYWICSSWRRQESCEQSQESVAPVERLGHCNAEQEQPVRLWRVPGTGGGLNYLLQFRKLFTGLNQSFGVGVKVSLSIFFEGLMVEMRSRQFDMKALVVSGNQCSPQKTGCIVNALSNISDTVCAYVVKNGRKKHAKETQIEWNIVVSSASLSWDGACILWCSIYITFNKFYFSVDCRWRTPVCLGQQQTRAASEQRGLSCWAQEDWDSIFLTWKDWSSLEWLDPLGGANR